MLPEFVGGKDVFFTCTRCCGALLLPVLAQFREGIRVCKWLEGRWQWMDELETGLYSWLFSRLSGFRSAVRFYHCELAWSVVKTRHSSQKPNMTLFTKSLVFW